MTTHAHRTADGFVLPQPEPPDLTLREVLADAVHDGDPVPAAVFIVNLVIGLLAITTLLAGLLVHLR